MMGGTLVPGTGLVFPWRGVGVGWGMAGMPTASAWRPGGGWSLSWSGGRPFGPVAGGVGAFRVWGLGGRVPGGTCRAPSVAVSEQQWAPEAHGQPLSQLWVK